MSIKKMVCGNRTPSFLDKKYFHVEIALNNFGYV